MKRCSSPRIKRICLANCLWLETRDFAQVGSRLSISTARCAELTIQKGYRYFGAVAIEDLQLGENICSALTLFPMVQATTVPVGAFIWISTVPPIIRAR